MNGENNGNGTGGNQPGTYKHEESGAVLGAPNEQVADGLVRMGYKFVSSDLPKSAVTNASATKNEEASEATDPSQQRSEAARKAAATRAANKAARKPNAAQKANADAKTAGDNAQANQGGNQ